MNAHPSVLSRSQAFLQIGGSTLPISEILNQGAIADAAVYRTSFLAGQPFPHVVFENLFSDTLLDMVSKEFDDLEDWKELKNTREATMRSRPAQALGPASQIYFDTVNSGRFIRFLADVTNIAGLVPDPLLRGGGLHESRPGGKFDLHLDFTKHPVTDLDNRLVMITYLNRNWLPEYGGALELWNVAENCCEKAIEPVFGRTILFYQSPTSLHGHPKPLTPPPGRTRRSVAAYYYSNGREDGLAAERYSTFFAPASGNLPASKVSRTMSYLLPPVLVDAGRMAKRLVTGSKGK